MEYYYEGKYARGHFWTPTDKKAIDFVKRYGYVKLWRIDPDTKAMTPIVKFKRASR